MNRLRAVLCTLALFAFSIPVSTTPADNPFAEDLAALFEELDRGYPFFGVKKIDKEWKALKKRLGKQVRRCRDETQFMQDFVQPVLRCLRDGHLRITDVRPKVAHEPEFYPPLSLLPATKKRVVVMSTNRNLASTLPPGTVITRIDGKPARKVLEMNAELSWRKGGFFSSPQRARFWEYRFPFSGTKGRKIKLHYLVGRKQKSIDLVANVEVGSWPHNYNQPEDLVQAGKSVWHSKLESGFGYIWLRRMDESVESGIRAALAAHGDARGWIVDLRGNTGGGYDSTLKTITAKLKQPVAAIIDAGSVSAAETYTRDLVNICKARVFGATSAGSSSKKKEWTFPSGIAKLRYSVESRHSHKGAIEYHGVTPDVEVEAVPEELQQGLNSEILRAVEWLEKTAK